MAIDVNFFIFNNACFYVDFLYIPTKYSKNDIAVYAFTFLSRLSITIIVSSIICDYTVLKVMGRKQLHH